MAAAIEARGSSTMVAAAYAFLDADVSKPNESPWPLTRLQV